MSGPKISVYSLTGRQREILAGQLQCERESLACAASIAQMLQQLQACADAIEQAAVNSHLLMKRAGITGEQLEEAFRFREKLLQALLGLQKELKKNTPVVSTKYTVTEAALEKKKALLALLQKLKEKTQALVQESQTHSAPLEQSHSGLQASILEDMGVVEETEAAAMHRDRGESEQEIRSSILEDIAGVYSFEPDDEPEDTTLADRKERVCKKLAELLADSGADEAVRQEIIRAVHYVHTITQMQYLTTYESVTVAGLVKKVAALKQRSQQLEAEFAQLLANYRALCAMAEETPVEVSCSEEACSWLLQETRRLETLAVRQREQAYIDECVNEVMADMGYDLIGRRMVTKRSGKHFRNELYSFQDGTAVNVTYSPGGQISMELGGIAREDRLPSAEETAVLTRDMEAFCGEFAEFERRLRAKGVVLGQRIAINPPTADYAAVINITDYEVGEGVQITELAATEKRKRTAEKKAMRRTE